MENVHNINFKCADKTAIGFLADVGETYTGVRQEFALLSDVLGLSLLVDSLNHRLTEDTVLGPFHTDEARDFRHGSLISGDFEGHINITRPGGMPQVRHCDQGIMGHGRTKPVALNISLLPCNFTEKNRGTHTFPGSHEKNVSPRNIFTSESTLAYEASTGTAIIFESPTLHGMGRNTEISGGRACVPSIFTHPAAEDELLSERRRSIEALRTGQAGAGGALGEAWKGIIVRRPRSEFKTVGKVRPSYDDEEVAKMISTGSHANNAQLAVCEAVGRGK
ncbi:hypothetical protein CORC01_13782 [Colletotrichum orchidophilum]|uniref:Catechol dioxygenase N-terminal domain-containing protein n=1 Tax=Colletotrichum orchidophilum TaxID=1209926 RepID=A0A1G4AP49_9PEZI|nr:uncharacterized protein CORC01_13782 [Colletotrichum orchidophilum]OHE90927.1 hypothetical protein CORC01_13782 [Colletotrichum orchidophilum]